MIYKAIVSDWNGTLFEDHTDKALNGKIIVSILFHVTGEILKGKWEKTKELKNTLKAVHKLYRTVKQYYKGERDLLDIYRIFDTDIVRGKPAPVIKSAMDKFAKEYAKRLDKRILEPLNEIKSDGKYISILSASWKYGIEKTLENSGYSELFDEIVANDMKICKGIISGFRIDIIYQKKYKTLEREFLKKRGFKEREILVLDDSEETFGEILPPGNFIVPFFAPEDFKEKMASKYRAFVPESETDLRKYLKSR